MGKTKLFQSGVDNPDLNEPSNPSGLGSESLSTVPHFILNVDSSNVMIIEDPSKNNNEPVSEAKNVDKKEISSTLTTRSASIALKICQGNVEFVSSPKRDATPKDTLKVDKISPKSVKRISSSDINEIVTKSPVSSKQKYRRKIDSTIHINGQVSHSLSNDSLSTTGSLKIRLRRDSAIPETKCGKKVYNLSTFCIVESIDVQSKHGHKLQSGNNIRVGDIVWAKLAGYPHWPSRVSSIRARTANSPSVSESSEDVNTLVEVPSNPSQAANYIAQVDWFAWNQCSYLSCAKLLPFLEYYEKLYNPRTKAKGYLDAVRIAKSFAEKAPNPNSSQSTLSPEFTQPLDQQSNASAPPSTDSHWSAPSTSDSVIPFTTPTIVESDEKITNQPITECTSTISEPQFNDTDDAADPDQGNPTISDLLPNLDIDCLAGFNSHLPSFSDDEVETLDSISKKYEIDFGS